MADPNFKAQGATGEISFKKNGDRKEPIIYLVKVVRNSHTGKLEFFP